MAKRRGTPARRPKGKKRPSKGGGLLRLLGWAGLGLAAGALLARRGERQAPAGGQGGEAPARRMGAEASPGKKQPTARPAETQDLDLPAAAESAWIPGPSGSLRLAELHASAPMAVVFVHGLGGSLDHWGALLSKFGPGLRGVALDLPGHGESDGVSFTVPDLAAAIGAVVDALSLRRFVLVGHSLGAAAAIEYAAGNGPRVAGLFLVDPNGDQTQLPARERRGVLDAMAEDAHGELEWAYRQFLTDAPADVTARVLRQLRETPADVLRGCLDAAFDYSPIPRLAAYEGPVRSLVSPLNDLPYSLHRLRPDLPYRELRGTGHWLMMERPAEVFSDLADFLDAARPRFLT